MNQDLSKSIAAAFALAGFCVALVSGLAVDNPLVRTLTGAIVALVVCYIAGSVMGSIIARIADDHLALYKTSNPGGAAPPAPSSPQHGGSP